MEKHYNNIKERFKNKEFTISDLCRLLNIKESTAYWIVRELRKKNLIVKPMRGIYKLASPKEIIPAKDIEKIRKHFLKTMTRKFSFTGLSILEPFIHHIPFVFIYHLFVERGSAEDFMDEIKKVSKATVLIEPSKDDVVLLLNNADIKKIIVIRENNYFYSSKHGLSSKEAAFVDLYFETTRKKMPFMRTDLEEIFKSLAINNMISYSRLLKYSKERGIKKEIKKFLRKMKFVGVPSRVFK